MCDGVSFFLEDKPNDEKVFSSGGDDDSGSKNYQSVDADIAFKEVVGKKTRKKFTPNVPRKNERSRSRSPFNKD